MCGELFPRIGQRCIRYNLEAYDDLDSVHTGGDLAGSHSI